MDRMGRAVKRGRALAFAWGCLAFLTSAVFASESRPASRTANGDSGDAVWSGDGRYVAFVSSADNLVPMRGNGLVSDVFRWDRVTGSTVLVSIAADSISGGNRPSAVPRISRDGRFVAFESRASNLVVGDTNELGDVFLRDLERGWTWRVSARPDSMTAAAVAGSPAGPSANPWITADGAWVLFDSADDALVPGDGNSFRDVFAFEVSTSRILQLSRTPDGPALGGDSYEPVADELGRSVGFHSMATNLPAADGDPTRWYLADRETGALRHVGVPPSQGGLRNWSLTDVLLHPSGRFLVLGLMAPRTPSSVVWMDRELGETIMVTQGFPLASTGISAGLSLSADGRRLAVGWLERFGPQTGSTNWVWTWEHGGTPQEVRSGPGAEAARLRASAPVLDPTGQELVLRVQVPPEPGSPWDGNSIQRVPFGGGTFQQVVREGVAAQFGRDGSELLIESGAPDLVPDDLNRSADLFIHDLQSGRLDIVSRPRSPDVARGPAASSGLGLSQLTPDGRFLLFTSFDPTLVPEDANQCPDVFRADLETGETRLVSLRADRLGPGNGASFGGAISDDGRWVVFTSRATDLAEGDDNRWDDVFLRDMESAVTWRVSAGLEGPSFGPRLSADGRHVVLLTGRSPGAGVAAYLWRRDSQTLLRVNDPGSGVREAVISSDGHRVGWLPVGSSAFGFEIFSGTSFEWALGQGSPWPRRELILSPDGRQALATGAAAAGGPPRLFWCDDRGAFAVLDAPADLPPDADYLGVQSPLFSSDGQRVVYCRRWRPGGSGAEGIRSDVMLCDLGSRSTVLVSVRNGIHGPTFERAREPDLNASGDRVVFKAQSLRDTPAKDALKHGIFVRDLEHQVTRQLTAGFEGSGAWEVQAAAPRIAGFGDRVVFESFSAGAGRIPLAGRLAAAMVPSKDEDRDGLDDDWERGWFADLVQGPLGDPDGDGDSNAEEAEAGTRPVDPDSRVWIHVASGGSESVRLQWDSVLGRSYSVILSTGLGLEPVAGAVERPGTGSTMEQVEDTAGSSERFYRLRVRR